MNIESANLSSLAPSSGAVESMSSPLIDGGVISEGFSSALVAQIELLSNIKTEDSLPLQTPDLVGLQGINGSQVVAGLSVGKIDMQDFAALLGNDLPPSYKIKDDVDHEAALIAVIDTLKYIAMGTTAGEKAAEAEQNMKNVIAMAVPVEQNVKDVVVVAVPVEQNMKDVIAMAVPVEQNMKDVIAMAVPVEQNMKDVVAVAVPVEQNTTDVIAMAVPVEQNVKDVVAVAVPVKQNTTDVVAEAEQGMKDAVVMDAPVQMDLKRANDKPDKKQVEGEAQIAGVEDNRGTEGLLTVIILPAVMPTEQGKAANNLAAADAIKEDGLLSFIKPSTGYAKPNQSAKASDDVLQSETVFRQSVHDKQGFNLKYFENAGQTEKTGRVERQVLSLEGEKTLLRVGTDITQLNRSVVDNKTDVPAMTKQLSHPEWNKDLGEQNVKAVVAVGVPVEQNTTDVVAEAKQSMKDAVVMDAPVQMDLKRANDKPDKKQVEGEAQMAGVEDNRGTGELLAASVLPAVMPAEQGKAVNNLAPADAIKEDALLSFIKPSTGDAKPNQPVKASDVVLQSEAVFRQPVRDKQDFNLKYFENAGQTEKTVRVERQVLSLEGEKTLPQVGTDITQLNRMVVDNKADVPAMTKPLAHPEWNKDLGERIVWMSSRAIPAAEIRLNPQHLGPISVRVDVADDQATVVFTAQHAAVKEALEASIPKLREMMSAQQLNLVEVNVSQSSSASDQGRSQSQNFAQTADGRGQGAASVAVDGDDVEQEIGSGRALVSKGLLSIYA